MKDKIKLKAMWRLLSWSTDPTARKKIGCAWVEWLFYLAHCEGTWSNVLLFRNWDGLRVLWLGMWVFS